MAGGKTFLTGPAGSGKSYQVREFLKRHPDTHVVASTGVAALNVGGMTVHRWSGMMLGPAEGQDPERFFEQLALDAKPSVRVAFNRVRRCKRLVIDEISMLSGRAFDYLDFHCRRIREDQRRFGGIQVIGTGDGLQLPPVRTNPALPYDWFFDAQAWQAGAFESVELRRIMRQDDPDFIEALSLIRRDFLEKNLLTPAVLRLKPGAKVMFTVNRPDDGFVNGQTGEVVHFPQSHP